MSKINKVLYNVDQTPDTVAAERRMARKNIGLDEVIGHATTADDTGIAPLGENGLVPAEYLPSFVNNVVDGYFYQGKFYRDSAHTTEISPDENTTYVDITAADLGVAYRYSTGSGEYFSITNQNAFGVVSDGTNTIHADKPIDLLTVVGNNGITTTVADTREQEQNGSDKLTIGHSNSINAGDIGESSPTTTISNTFNLPWASFDGQGHITATGSNAITIQNASTSGYGVTKLTSTPGSGETLAMTPKGVQTAIGALNATVNSSGGTNVALTVTEASGVITGVSITRDNTAAATHEHGNVSSDGKVTTVAQTKNALLVTNSSNQITVGPTFGSATGDDALFLNKQGNWSGINEATSSALGGIKIGYTKNATKYPVELSDGKAYVDVPCSEIKLWRGGLAGSVHQNLMTIYEGSSTGALAGVTFNNENSSVTMVKKPTTGDGGKVLTVTEPGGQVSPYYEWKELPYPAIVQTYHNGADRSYTWVFNGISSNFSKAAVTITDLEPNKLHTVEFDMFYSQNYADPAEMYVFASASETNNSVPFGYSRISAIVGDPVDGKYPRLVNCSWTLNSSSNGEIFINIVGNADSENRINKVTIYDVNYTVTRLK